MAKGVKFVKDESGIVDMLQSDGIASSLRGPAELVLAAAKANAPVATGEYRNSLKLVEEISGDRAVARVTSDAPHAMIVEANTGNLARSLGG